MKIENHPLYSATEPERFNWALAYNATVTIVAASICEHILGDEGSGEVKGLRRALCILARHADVMIPKK